MTPHEFAITNGWDATCIEATARDGVSPDDLERLEDTDLESDDLLAWCRAQCARRSDRRSNP